MSGIAGIFHFDGRPVGEELDRMVDAMEHRGPDGADTWRDGSVGLGHLMLETTPEDQYESLPLVDRTGNFAITADGRIDNRDELIKTLDVREPDDQPITDTELILAAYKRWGRDCPKKLLGAFAFAVWDAREQTLTLARDHFGIRPLSYVHQPGKYFACASLEFALIRAGLSDGEVNDRKVADFLLVPADVEPEETYWRDIYSVSPAHTVQVGPQGRVAQKQYWALDPERVTKLESDEAYIERFQTLFEEAVRCRMRSSTPVASMMSGGLDSTSVACTVAQKLQGTDRKLPTLSAVFDSIPQANERAYQEAAIEMYNGTMAPVFFSADEVSPLLHHSEIIQKMGRPNVGINSYILAQLYKCANNRNVRVVLDGFDGDTTVSHGRKYLHELLWSGQWVKLWNQILSSVEFQGGTREDHWRAIRGWAKHYLRGNPLTRPVVRLWRDLRDTNKTPEEGALSIREEGGAWSGEAWRRYFQEDLVDRVGSRFKSNHRDNRWTKERYHHWMMLSRPMMESALRSFDAKATAADVEVRFPFYDVRLVEYCLSLPGHLKFKNGWTRWIERKSMEGVLPKKVQWRKGKPDLVKSYVEGLLKHEKSTFSSLAEVLASDAGSISQYVKTSVVADLASKMAEGKLAEQKHESQRVLLWRVFALRRWLSSRKGLLSRNSQSVGHGRQTSVSVS